MTKLFDISFASDFGDATLRANGIVASGDPYPASGIPGRLVVGGGMLEATVYKDDALTFGGRRAEVEIGSFPSNAGEFWSTFEFMLPGDWSYNKLMMMGSWYPTPDVGDTTKHVTIGLRLLGTTLLIIVPDSLPGETDVGKTVGRFELAKGRWYSVCIHAVLATTATGMREVYVDGVPILREFGIATTYNDVDGPYFKLGPYDGNSYNDFDYLRLYLRNAKVWIDTNGFNAVMGTVPMTPQRMQK